MNLLKPGKLGQEMRGEPEEAFGLADVAERDLEVGDAPRRPRAPAGPAASRSPSERSEPARRTARGQKSSRIGSAIAAIEDLPGTLANEAKAPRPGPADPRKGTRPSSGRTRPGRSGPCLPPSSGTRIEDALGKSLSTIRFRPRPPCALASLAVAKFLTQTPGWKSSG